MLAYTAGRKNSGGDAGEKRERDDGAGAVGEAQQAKDDGACDIRDDQQPAARPAVDEGPERHADSHDRHEVGDQER
ncbi:MAG: hypothetical protein H0V45_13005 [Actinobacteria bacterium]|nr:hypothetical protein [Actinomycetota bacterium]